MEGNYSDDDIVDKQHSLLLKNAAASYGRKFQRIKPPSRNEASVEVSEFHLLSKRSKGKELVNDLTTSLDKTGKHAQVSQKVKKVKKLFKSLPAPLEKPEAEKIKRTVAFDASKTLLNRWEPIVGANRVADQLNFPLNVPYFRATSSKNFLMNPRGKTPLEKEVESLLFSVSTENKEDQKKTFFLNRKEIMLQRRELAHIRAQQSFKEAKAWRQNKIKSKKYHRILRRERTKKQIQEFEELQKTDPEAALKKLEELEKTRVEERITLRHRSTGQWARNKAVHAKYDKQCREVLAQQLRLGKELTQKVCVIEGSDGEDEAEENRTLPNQENNPWMHKDSNEYQEFSTSYQKYWNQQQAEKNNLNKPANSSDVDSSTLPVIRDSSSHIGNAPESVERMAKEAVGKANEQSLQSVTTFGFIVNSSEKQDTKRSVGKAAVNSNWECTTLKKSVNGVAKQKKESIEKIRFSNDLDLDDIFEEMEETLKHKVQKKLSSIKLGIKETTKSAKKNTRKAVKVTESKGCVQSLRGRKQHFGVSGEMNETFADFDKDIKATGSILSRISASTSATNAFSESQRKATDLAIDPKNFISIDASKPLKTAIPNMSEADDDDDREADTKNNSLTIAEAFLEDDIANKFRQEKEAAVEEDKVKSVDLNLPGWGEWTGKGLPYLSKRKKKCFLINPPKYIPRKDDRKESIIINENADAKARVHQVSELPFPYSRVDSFEASIRAPLGSTWIPEIAHKKLTARKVSTLMGAVIEPLTEEAIIDESEMENFGEREDFVPEEL